MRFARHINRRDDRVQIHHRNSSRLGVSARASRAQSRANLIAARRLYRATDVDNPDRVVLLCQSGKDFSRARIIRTRRSSSHTTAKQARSAFVVIAARRRAREGWTAFAQPSDHIRRSTTAHDSNRRSPCLCCGQTNPTRCCGYIWERP